uniref:Centrosomal protein of 162 kDa n=1 Tax=Varanus komodoensis TaxID=61221 RepID=A0A8D2JBT7_VARKO
HSIVEVDEDNAEGIQLQQPNVSVSLSRDSLETNDSVVALGPAENCLLAGLDTLEEQEEKEQFFADLEKGVSSTIDYSRLNKELDSNNSEELQTFLSYNPVKWQYSVTFISFLVLLLDSQDSTLDAQKVNEQQDIALEEHSLPHEATAEEMNGTGISCGQTNSDIEALHQAYCHIEQSLGDTDEQKNNVDKMIAAENLIRDASQDKEDCPRNTSATDSDLPTIEELMKPIKADSSFARGYDLEPARYSLIHSRKFLVEPIIHGASFISDPFPPILNPCPGVLRLSNNLHFVVSSLKSVVQASLETLKMIQKLQLVHSVVLIKKQVMHKNTKSTAIHRKKALSGPHSSVRSSGYGKSSCLLKHFPAGNEKTESIKKPVLKSKSPPRQKGTCCLMQNERELYLLKRVQEAEEKLNAANDLVQHLKATSLQKEKEMETKILEMKMQQNKELFQLNQENYALRTQLNNREDVNKGTKWSHIWGRSPDDGEMLKEIQKEVQNQETLLQGYQQENERLYKQVKELQLKNKKNEENMFKENQRLMTELASLREQVDKNNILSCGAVQNVEPPSNQSFTDLILELRAAKVKTNLLEERKHLKQEKQALEVDLAQVKKERDLARVQIASTSAEKSYEMKIMEESYKEEITRLHKRLQWYAENQELLDKDAAHLRGAKEEIDKLKLEVDKLRSEAGNQCAQQKKRLKDRVADAKRIQDLERQVKEMEMILKRRHPNSLPALIYAAATAASEGDGDASARTNTVDFLERRVKKLEGELEGKDDEAKKSLRAMEQQFQKIKLQYEKRIGELEQLLAYKLLNEPQKPQDETTHLAALEQEFCNVNKAHEVVIKNLQAEIASLRNQITQLEIQRKATDEADLQSLEYQVEQTHAKAKLVRLNQELIAKNREIQDLTKTVERLQKERRIMLSAKESSGKTANKETSSGILKKDIVSSNPRNPRNEELFPEMINDKKYQPKIFADSHISEVLQENTQLKDELEKLTLELSQNYFSYSFRKEDLEEYVAALKVSHQKEMEEVLGQRDMQHSVTELNNKISTQAIFIKHLQQQVCELQRDREALAVSQKREEILQKEMAKLLEELGEARESQSPEMKHFVCLERKIKQLEARYEQREQELQQVIKETQHIAEVEQIQETEKWKKLVLLKNQELEKFRIELDSMLDVLQQLQKQGVIIPVSGSNMPENYWKI